MSDTASVTQATQGTAGRTTSLKRAVDLVGARDLDRALVQHEATLTFLALAERESLEPDSGLFRIRRTYSDSGERPDAVRVIEKLLLPEDIGSGMFDEEKVRLGKGLRVQANEAKETRLRRVALESHGHVAPDFDWRLQAGNPIFPRAKELFGTLTAESDEPHAVEPFGERADPVVRKLLVDDAQNLEVALAEHRAAVSRSPRLDRPFRSEPSAVRALPG